MTWFACDNTLKYHRKCKVNCKILCFHIRKIFKFSSQSLTVFPANTNGDNIENQSVNPQNSTTIRPQISSEKSTQKSTTKSRPRSGLPISTSNRSAKDSTTTQSSSTRHNARNAIASASKLPLALRNSYDNVTRTPKSVVHRTANVEAQSSNLNLTTEERETLISKILTTELLGQSKKIVSTLKSKNDTRHATQSKRIGGDQLIGSYTTATLSENVFRLSTPADKNRPIRSNPSAPASTKRTWAKYDAKRPTLASISEEDRR